MFMILTDRIPIAVIIVKCYNKYITVESMPV